MDPLPATTSTPGDATPDAAPTCRVALQSPKKLYRLIADLLASAERIGDRRRLIKSCLAAFFDAFREELGLACILVYDERRRYFHLVHTLGAEEPDAADCLPADLPALLPLLQDRSHTYGTSTRGVPVCLPADHAPRPGVGVVVSEPRSRHLVFFFLERRRDVALVEVVANTLRAVLASRLLHARWGDAMHEAGIIQRALLPQRAPLFAGFDVSGRSVAAEEVGGDFFDYQVLPDGGRLGVALGDVSGHGLAAALVARDVVVGLRMACRQDLRIARRLSELNSVLHANSVSSSFVSVFHGELEQNGNLFYVNAGQAPPLCFKDGEVTALYASDAVLGPVRDASFKQHHLHVDRGATLVLYTDGIVERQSPGGELFGEARLIEAVRWHLDASAERIVEGVFHAAGVFGDGAAWEDDATVVVVRRLS